MILGILKIIGWTLWIWFVFGIMVAVVKVQTYNLVKQIMELYFERRMSWLKEMDDKFGSTSFSNKVSSFH